METAYPAKPSLIPAILALLVVLLFGYLLYSDLNPTRTEHTINPPIEIIDPQELPPLTIIEDNTELANSEKIIELEANVFVENLSPTTHKSVTVKEYQDQFVRPNNLIALPDLEQRNTTLQELARDKNIAADTPVTLNFSIEERSQTTLANLSNTIEDHNETITIITTDGRTLTASLAELLNREDLVKNAEITLVLLKQHSVHTRFSDIANIELSPSQSLVATIEHGVQELSINDMIPDNAQDLDSLYYLHRVTENDVQGLWGIIQSGLIDKFRQGLRLEGVSQNKDLIQAVIPSDADEKLSSGLSSFLGKILDKKVDNSYIYNIKTQGVSFDARALHSGQQLVIIRFSPSELKQIYQFFSDKRNQGTNTFAITD